MYSNLESVEQLFRQYYKVLRVYAFRFVNDWDIAEDVVQDVFVALWNKRTDIELVWLSEGVCHSEICGANAG